MFKESQNKPSKIRLSGDASYIIYKNSKIMENEHYFEGRNEISNFSKESQKETSGLRLLGVPSYIIYKNSKNMEN